MSRVNDQAGVLTAILKEEAQQNLEAIFGHQQKQNPPKLV